VLFKRGRVADDGRDAGKLPPQDLRKPGLALERDDPLRRAAPPQQATGQAAGAGAQFQYRARSGEIDQPRHDGGEAGTARSNRGDLQRLLQPQAEEQGGVAGHSLPQMVGNAGTLAEVCYNFCASICGVLVLSRRKTVISAC
jgi:hypothetical protein